MASASSDSRPPTSTSTAASSLRRLRQRSSSQNRHQSQLHSGSIRSNRTPLASRLRSSRNNNADLSSGGSLPISCPPPTGDQASTISRRYRNIFVGCYRDLGVDLQASSPESLESIPSDESDAEDHAHTQQGDMARLRRLSRTGSSHTPSHTPDSAHPPDNQESASRTSSTRRWSIGQAPSPAPLGPAPIEESPATTPDNPETAENENNTAQDDPSRPRQKAIIRFYPYQDPHHNSRPSLHFIPVSRTLPSESCTIRVGRYSERDGVPVANPAGLSDAPVGFKSKVVSRRHCEFLYSNAQWHVKDVGSSSGTFLNHMRLSQPNMVSRLYPIKDGDIVQLGIDFRGGEEMIFRCVRLRIECNRSWQQKPNEFKYVC